ncbi:Hypothetical protein NTJ_07584 [Nesidiocoris tenuis]|uniref:Uncharacterized protein n=1 Tax=Nesidiocoris tenuis TaxID=355587 RepID=A0ABN7ARD6_9HEMI|nr:Hypothetical protein NTJ_07584 [Nesidiocoris tenuis]
MEVSRARAARHFETGAQEGNLLAILPSPPYYHYNRRRITMTEANLGSARGRGRMENVGDEADLVVHDEI